MNFGKNIKNLRIEANLTQAEVANILGIKQSSYVSWEQKDNNPTLELLKKLSQLYHCSIENIIEKNDIQKDEKELINNYQNLKQEQKQALKDFAHFLLLQNKEKKLSEKVVIELKTYKQEELYCVLVEDEQLSAGFGNSVTNTNTKYKAYTEQRLSRYDGAARIKGDSMEPDYPDYSIATFLNTGFDRNGEVYAISQGDLGDEQLYIKQVFQEENRFRIHSLNPKYKDFYLDRDDNFRIIGPVIDNFNEIEEAQIED
ncbi:S24 family peptidase [Lactococcus nasutitermitis]|uniref:S24 family peptidase n=1 Tax=Lactococcus nasutitermitis TaxID=1652957 RepID=A0ABV9JEL5_9LACT|nr:S24 family peptidase [Lactococcus nasutitermitis]